MKKIKVFAVCMLAGCFAATGTVLAEKDGKGERRGGEHKGGDHKDGDHKRGDHKGRPGGFDFDARFSAMDADSSGEVSKAEFEAAHAKRLAAMKERLGDKFDESRASSRSGEFFGKMDADSNGSLTKEEMKKGFASMRGHREGGPRRGGDHKGGEHKRGDKKGGRPQTDN